MPNPGPLGKTLWEMFIEKLRGGANGNGSLAAFANPLDLRVGSPFLMPAANGPAWADHSLTVREIRDYSRLINGEQFTFTDYVLQAVNTKSFAKQDEFTARLRVVPNETDTRDSLLLELEDEFGFAEDFLAVVRDTTGVFEVTNDDTGAKEIFTRINDVLDSHKATVLVVTGTTTEGKAIPGETGHSRVEYWDYWRDCELGGRTVREFLFVEMNNDSGWFQIWRAREFFA